MTINCFIKRNIDGDVIGFTIENHGDQLLCSAVSSLVLNTVNSITELTETDIYVDFNEDGGFMDFQIIFENGDESAHDALLLLKSLELGLNCLVLEYPKGIKVSYQKNNKQ